MNIHIDTDVLVWVAIGIAGFFILRALYRKWRWWALKRDVGVLTDLIGIRNPMDDMDPD